MKRALTALAILSFVLALGTRADAFISDCLPSGEFIVNAATADSVKDGYINDNCKLIIEVSIPDTTLSQVFFKAKGIAIGGASKVVIHNPIAGGEIDLISEKGADITINNAEIWARGVVKTVCSGGAGLCKIKVDASSIIAANPLGDITSLQGDLFFSAGSDIDIKTSTIYGGAGVHMGSDRGHIVWICTGGGPGDCKDPNVPPIPPIVLAQCQAPPPAPPGQLKFPCNLTLADAAELKGVCFPVGGGVVCGGGSNEIRITAFLFVDITGSTIIALDHITIESVTQDVRAANSTITAKDAINVSAKTTVDLQGADWEAKRITVVTGTGCSGATICINANGATTSLVASDQIGMSANNNTGVISVCDGSTVSVPQAGNQVILNGNFCPLGPSVKASIPTCLPLGPPLVCQ